MGIAAPLRVAQPHDGHCASGKEGPRGIARRGLVVEWKGRRSVEASEGLGGALDGGAVDEALLLSGAVAQG